jgi:hypothetical protein
MQPTLALSPARLLLALAACVALSSHTATRVQAAIWPDTGTDPCIDVMPSDYVILNFALNLGAWAPRVLWWRAPSFLLPHWTQHPVCTLHEPWVAGS